MPDAVARFSGFAAEYDAARPKPPAALVQVILQWAGTATPDVVDLGAGTAEIAVHGHEQGDAGRLVATALSQGGAVALLAGGATEDELGLTALREVAARRLPQPRTWWWTYRIRLAVT